MTRGRGPERLNLSDIVCQPSGVFGQASTSSLYSSYTFFVCLFDLILYVPSTIFQLNRDVSFWVEPVLS